MRTTIPWRAFYLSGNNRNFGGDVHLANFGIFASPERDLVADQTEKDHQVLLNAIQSGEITAEMGI